MSWEVQALAPDHERKDFCCGEAQLDAYIRVLARQHGRKNLGRTYVAVGPGSKRVQGYYTLSASSVAFVHAADALRNKLPRYPLPTALLGKLAVAQSARGQGLGAFLLLDALHRIVEIGGQMAVFAVEVHALNDGAKAFYTKYGFQEFEDQPSHLFLPMSTARQLF